MTSAVVMAPNTWVHVKGTDDVFRVHSVRQTADGTAMYTLKDQQDFPFKEEFRADRLEQAPSGGTGAAKPDPFW